MQTQLTIPVIIKYSKDISQTLTAFAGVQNQISKCAFNRGKPLGALDLHRKTYSKIKRLSSQMTCSAIRLTAGSYSSARRNRHNLISPFKFKPRALFLIGKKGRDASFTQDGKLSIWTTTGRKRFTYAIPEHFKERFTSAIEYDSLNITERSGKFLAHLCITVNMPEPKGVFPVGVDRNETNPIVAVDLAGREFFENGLVRRIKNTKIRKLRKRLNAKLVAKKAEGMNTHSVIRLLKRLGHDQRNRTKTYTQTVAKRFVEWCPKDAIIILEDLNMPQLKRSANYKIRKGVRRRLSQWFRSLLETSIRNKATQNGIAVASVSPYNTSQNCSRCGIKGTRQKHRFSCSSCGFVSHADTNAAVNIRNRFTVLRGSGLLSMSPEAYSLGKPPALAGGN